MKIQSTNNRQSFGFVLPPAYIHTVQDNIPAITQKVQQTCNKFCIKEFQAPAKSLLKLSKKNSTPKTDCFCHHEAVVPDTKIRIVGPKQNKKSKPIITAKLKGEGRTNINKKIF